METCDYTVFLVAGIETNRDFFDDLRHDLMVMYEAVDKKVFIQTIFPYGDNSANMAAQMVDVNHDMRLADNHAQHSKGGRGVRSEVEKYSAGGELVMIGHSGGGVAGYHGAKMLEELDGYKVKHIAQIGAPKVRISPSFQQRVSYIYDIWDPVVRLGSWSVKFGTNKYAPAHRLAIHIKGNHIDYFSELQDRHGVTNLSKTLSAIWRWIGEE